MLQQEMTDLLDTEPLTDSETAAGDDAGALSECSTDSECEDQLDALEEMGITGCGTGRRIHMLMDPDDWTTDQITERIRDAYPPPVDRPVHDGLQDEEPWTAPDPATPETCEATRDQVPEAPPPTEDELPNPTLEELVDQVILELRELTLTDPPKKVIPEPAKITAALRRADSIMSKPPKDGTAAYWRDLADAIAGMQSFIARNGGTLEATGWGVLLAKIVAALEAARVDPYAGLPLLPSFWPAPPAGYRVPPITPIYQAPPGGSLARGTGYAPTRTAAPTVKGPTTTITFREPPPGLTPAAEEQWRKLYARIYPDKE